MNEQTLTCTPIGVIRTPYKTPADTPKAGVVCPDEEGCLELNPFYTDAASSMKPGGRYMILFWFHKSKKEYEQIVHWRGYGDLMGLFSTHSPNRPNPIGVSTVTVTRIEPSSDGGPVRIWFTGVDMTDGTPVLDIKSEDLNS